MASVLCFSSMFGMGMGELIIIVVVALLALGPERLPEAAKKIGQTIRGLRRQTSELRTTIEQDTQLGDAMREIRSALNEDVTKSKKTKAKPGAGSKATDGSESAAANTASSDGTKPEDGPVVVTATDGLSRDDAIIPPRNSNETEAAIGAAAETNGHVSAPPRKPAAQLSEYESYIHMWGAEAAAKKYGTSVAHAQATLEATMVAIEESNG